MDSDAVDSSKPVVAGGGALAYSDVLMPPGWDRALFLLMMTFLI
jgi:hypothetical protein